MENIKIRIIMENGKEKDILGNFSSYETQYDTDADALKFGDDFNKELVGIAPEHTLEALTSGEIEKDHVLYVTYSYNYKYKTEGSDVEKWKTVKEESTVVIADFAKLLAGAREITAEVDGRPVTLLADFTARQRAVLLAGGLLNYTKNSAQ